MASTTFTDFVTPITASWLNDTNTTVYVTVPANTAAIATKAPLVNANLVTPNIGVAAGTSLALTGSISANSTGGTSLLVQDTTTGYGVRSYSGTGYAIYANSSSVSGIAVWGAGSTGATGVQATSVSGKAIYATTSSGTGLYIDQLANNSTGPAITVTPQSSAPTTSVVAGSMYVSVVNNTSATLHIHDGTQWRNVVLTTVG